MKLELILSMRIPPCVGHMGIKLKRWHYRHNYLGVFRIQVRKGGHIDSIFVGIFGDMEDNSPHPNGNEMHMCGDNQDIAYYSEDHIWPLPLKTYREQNM